MERGGTAQLVKRRTEKARRNTDAGSSLRCGKGFFSESQLPVNFQRRLSRLYSPRVQSHAATSACALKIPNTGSHTIVWTHENTAHTDRNGWRCSCGCCSLTRSKAARISRMGLMKYCLKLNSKPHYSSQPMDRTPKFLCFRCLSYTSPPPPQHTHLIPISC